MAELAISSQYRHLYINNIYLYLNSVTHVCMSVLRNHNNNNNNLRPKKSTQTVYAVLNLRTAAFLLCLLLSLKVP